MSVTVEELTQAIHDTLEESMDQCAPPGVKKFSERPKVPAPAYQQKARLLQAQLLLERFVITHKTDS